ncbi:MAG: MlaA family lipoprotein [Lysobacteraceae bacterium]
MDRLFPRLLPALALYALATVAHAQDAAPAAPPLAQAAAPVASPVPPAPASPAPPATAPDVEQPADALVAPGAAAPADATPAPDAAEPTPAPVPPGAPAGEVPGDAGTPADATAPAAGTAPAAALPAGGDTPTQAEQDYNAIYGGQDYNPVADPTLPPPAQLPESFDPWEKWNRKVHRFNNAVDRRVAKPLAKAYVAVVPRPVRLGVSNFFSNLAQPVSAVNALLQGEPKLAAQALGRFALNTTLGVGGLFDPASDAHLPHHSEDFGQTLGVWGWKRSRYVELPLFGPRTVRDVFGMAGDAPLAPLPRIENDRTRVFLQGLQLVDIRTQLFAVDGMREGAADDYTLVRDAWLQRRNYQISGDRQQSSDSALPDYLQDDTANPSVPVDAMPMPESVR